MFIIEQIKIKKIDGHKLYGNETIILFIMKNYKYSLMLASYSNSKYIHYMHDSNSKPKTFKLLTHILNTGLYIKPVKKVDRVFPHETKQLLFKPTPELLLMLIENI
jgi:hypothetical protein